ncbi:hypothetical protein ACU8L9_01400 [Rhizobium leguminosarum]
MIYDDLLFKRTASPSPRIWRGAAADERSQKGYANAAGYHFRTTTIVAIFVKAGRIDAV